MDYKEKVIALLNSKELSKEQKEKLEDIFPELKESEDVKIRKSIINLVIKSVQNGGMALHKWESQQMLAWLEKQGKNNMGISEATKKKLEDSLNKALEKETPESWNKFLEGEQKPADDEMITLLHTEYEKGRADAIAEMQKPWSEKDEKTLKDIITSMTNLKDSATSDALRDIYNSKIDWLKSLKDKCIPQPKQEWSEEDLYMIENALFGTYARDIATRLLNKIKSLIPQNRWKPSDEQMKCLDNVKGSDDHNGYVLNTLYNDLKKLREE